MIEWLVAQTRPQAEAQADRHLRRQGFCVYLPRYLKLRRHARRQEWVPRPLFPRYLFVGIDPAHSRWRSIRSTFGISQLVCAGDRPLPVPSEIVAELRSREDENGMMVIQPEVPFQRGDQVRVDSGALCDGIGIFECIDDDRRVVILLDLLGRQVRVRLPLEAVAAHS